MRLRELGATVAVGHHPDNVGDSDVVVRSTAVGLENTEIASAVDRGIPVIRRAEMLAELMRLKHGIAVAGTHGKTTTTSMLAAVMAHGGLDPTVVIGGRLDSLGGTNAKLGAGDYLVAEADESDGSFMLLSPTATIITNIDPEHLEHYGTVDVLEDTFVDFANKVPFYGFSVMCLDHPRVQHLLPRIRRRVVTYGFARQADYRATHVHTAGLKTTFEVAKGEEILGEICLAMPGQHNISNAVAAVAMAMELNIDFPAIREALDGFTGVQRRFTVVGEAAGVTVIDDYGHHPVEIEATLQAAESAWPERRIIAVFQPHRFTRVQHLFDEFCGAFNRAAEVVVCPIHAAGEEPIEGVDHQHIANVMRNRGHRGTVAVDGLEGATAHLKGMVRAGDVVITLGAGSVNAICPTLLAILRAG